MKRVLKYIPLLLLIITVSCEEEGRIDFIGTAGELPAQILNATITPTPGGGVVSYDVPKDENFLYAKAIYETKAGVTYEARSSKYQNTLILEGYGDTLAHDVSIYSVGRNEKESAPLVKTFHPLNPPVYAVAEQLEMNAIFGGIEVLYENETEANLIMELFIDTIGSGDWLPLDKLYTKTNAGRWTYRGLDSETTSFAVSVKDPFGNSSNLVEKQLKPLFEQEIPKTDFADLKLPNDTQWLRSKNPITQLWDGKSNSGGNFFATDQGKDPMPKWISIDFGAKYVLSRMKQWQRRGEEYLDGRIADDWEIYGSNEPNPDGSWDSWTLLHKFGEPYKPSGLPNGQRTDEDIEYARKGFDYEFETIPEAYRFYRIKWNSAPSGEQFILIGEMSFWGQPAEEN
ncbi:DUF4959 domain-containing protein [Puteibacter caeruleilacunae]|nr:DUF4959 domain-containing protein [Puteibacter caeruleilacunae]